MADIVFFDQIAATDGPRVGGKGLSLGRSFTAGLPVPPGFVITVAAYQRSQAQGVRSDATLAQAIRDAYHRLGGGAVAVRSSATAEDGAAASFAGQAATFLGIVGDEALFDAIDRCWQSLQSERAVAYRTQQNVSADGLAMAVVVQVLVPADVAGVMFTADPRDPTGTLMAIEAAWGLGEVVVSGRVTPDRFRVIKATGAVTEKHAGRKTVRVTAIGDEAVPANQVEALCLSDSALSQLADLGRRVEAFYGDSRDVEWAIAGGQCYLLQARPITTSGASEREIVRAAVIEQIATLAEPGETVWVRYNLSEVLPEPTPMTWGIVNRLLAADGGFGAMNRDFGAIPDPTLGSQSGFDLIAGRPMMNLSRAPRLQFARPPYEYPFAALKANPAAALDPKPVLNPGRVGLLRLPTTIWRLMKIANATKKLADSFTEKFERETLPQFATAARTALAADWSQLEPAALKRLVDEWTEKTLVEFARESLKPTVFADLAWSTVMELVKPKLGEAKARAAVGELAVGAKPPLGSNLAEGVREFAAGRLDKTAFLERFGHRCRNEMELSQPRWREDPLAIAQLLATGSGPAPTLGDDPQRRIAIEAGSPPGFEDWVARLRIFLGLREAAKHHLLLGYAVIRRALVELGRATGIYAGIFYLHPSELEALITGTDFSATIADRKQRRQLELSLELPAVLFSDDLGVIGRPLPIPVGATTFTGLGLSAGTAEATALVLTDPATVPPSEPYILVCPSTDPAWVPLFAKAKGLVMETGGVLSHGAIVAREFGLPAAAGLPGITQQIRTGQMVRVDGATGVVVIVD